MAKKKSMLADMLYVRAVFMLLFILSFLSMVPGAKVQAAEFDNFNCTFTSTNDEAVSTQANPNETTVLIFGHTKCGYTRATLNSVSSCSWVKRSDIRVIFAETNGHTKEEVKAYEEGYQCPEMIFCYDESYGIPYAMVDYAGLFGMGNGGSYPVIVLIDKNNKVRSLLSGTKTADEILSEIKKFENIDTEGGTGSSGSDPGFENFAYGLKTIEGATVSTKANPGETTVLLFGNTGCAYTAAALQDIDKSGWAKRSDIRVIYADVYGADLSETKEYAKNYPEGNIIFCHDESGLNFSHALSYIGLDNHTGGQFPFIILIDKNNKVRKITLGPKTADEIFLEIEKITKEDQNAGGNNQEVSNVAGFAAVSDAKNVKLAWNQVPGAAGYEIYQYDHSKKTWIMKAALGTVTSYTVKGLSFGTNYRFAVRAFVNLQGKGRVYSREYVFVDTATAPKDVKFKVKAGKKKAVITWEKAKGATGYTVYYKTKAKGSWKKLKNIKKTSYTKTKLKSGKTYFFTVKAYKKYKGKTYTGSSRTRKVKIK